jgi:hypothetical protein
LSVKKTSLSRRDAPVSYETHSAGVVHDDPYGESFQLARIRRHIGGTVDPLRLWKGWVFRGITGRKYRSMKRALIITATACFALSAVGTSLAELSTARRRCIQ